mgnify:FL=1
MFTLKMNFPVFKKTHRAAVKALAWSKVKNNILATGGGTNDKKIKIWNT